MRAKIQDFAEQWLLSILLVGFILFQHYWSIAHVPPVLDGSNHVAAVSNLGLMLNAGEWGRFASGLMADGNNFLSHLYFSLFSAVIGPGRIAWGWAWAFAIGVLTFSGLKLCRDQKSVFVTALGLVILCSTLVDRDGGILDQRVDSFSVLILILMTTALIQRRWTWTAFLTFFAIMAKGVALPVSGVILGAAIATGMIPQKEFFQEVRKRRFYWLSLIVLFLIYSWVWLRPVIAYNLLALHRPGSGHTSLRTLKAGILHGMEFYRTSLLHRDILSFFLTGFSIVFVFLIGGAPSRERSMVRWGLLSLAATFFIFSSHPVVSPVLLIWLTPSFWILGFAFASLFFSKWGVNRKKGLWTLGLVLFCGTFIWFQNYGRHLYDLNENETAQWQRIYQSSREISALVRSSHLNEQKQLFLYPDFLYWISGYLELNYDAFRVMTFENLGKSAPILIGWELGTYSGNWKPEIAGNGEDTPAVVLLLVDENVSLFPGHPIHVLSSSVKTELDRMKCAPQAITDPRLENVGRLLVYITNGTMSRCLNSPSI